MQFLNVNTDAVVKFTNKLEKLKRSAFPVAVRTALNSTAMDMKKNTMPKSAKASFVKREPNFFKANSLAEMAQGFDIKTMKATVGFTGNDQAVEDLEMQEHGGNINGRSFIPMKTARVGNSDKKPVLPLYRMVQIKNHVINAQNGKGSPKQRFIRAAIVAKKLYGNDAYILGNVWKGRQTLSKIDEIWSSSRHGTHPIEIRRTPVYSFLKGRNVKVKGKQFMQRAAEESHLKMSDYYITAARKQFAKALG